MESESPEKSQLRFSEKRGLLVYEGEFSPDFPLGLSGAVPLRSATWGGNTRLTDSAPSARERTLRNKRLAKRVSVLGLRQRFLSTSFHGRKRWSVGRMSFWQAGRGRLNSDKTTENRSNNRVGCFERHSKNNSVRG